MKGYQGLYVQAYVRATDPTFAVGEYWSSMGYQMTTNLKPDQDPHRQLIIDWIDDTRGNARAFDFTTKGILFYISSFLFIELKINLIYERLCVV